MLTDQADKMDQAYCFMLEEEGLAISQLKTQVDYKQFSESFMDTVKATRIDQIREIQRLKIETDCKA